MVLRQTFWIDRSVQGVLIGRVVLYWSIGILYVGLGSAFFQYYQHPDWAFGQHAGKLFEQFWPWIPSLILFMPLVIHDVIRTSNLFAGPIHRLRMHLAELIADPNCRPLTFRDDDYWQDLVAPVNQLQNEIRVLRLALESAGSSDVAPEEAKPQPVASVPEVIFNTQPLPAIGMVLDDD